MAALLRKSWLKNTLMERLQVNAQNRFVMNNENTYLCSVEPFVVKCHAQLIAYISDELPAEDTKDGLHIEISDKLHFIRAEITREAMWQLEEYDFPYKIERKADRA